MAQPEHLLPIDQSMDALLVNRCEAVKAVLDELKQTAGDVIDPESELFTSPFHLWQDSRRLAALLQGQEEPTEEVDAVLYRGLRFGLQLAEMIYEKKPDQLQIGQYLDLVARSKDRIEEEVIDFFDARPELAFLLEEREGDIDPSGRYYHHVQTGLGVALLLIERQRGQEHQDGTIAYMEATFGDS
jgi:hypothetical protein